MTNFKSYKYEKHSREICYGVQVLIPYITHSQNERYISIEVSAETLKTTEATETTTGLDSLETRGSPGLGNQTTSSPGR